MGAPVLTLQAQGAVGVGPGGVHLRQITVAREGPDLATDVIAHLPPRVIPTRLDDCTAFGGLPAVAFAVSGPDRHGLVVGAWSGAALMVAVATAPVGVTMPSLWAAMDLIEPVVGWVLTVEDLLAIRSGPLTSAVEARAMLRAANDVHTCRALPDLTGEVVGLTWVELGVTSRWELHADDARIARVRNRSDGLVHVRSCTGSEVLAEVAHRRRDVGGSLVIDGPIDGLGAIGPRLRDLAQPTEG